MMRSFYAVIENSTQAFSNFFGIGPTHVQAQHGSDAQAEQAQNQLALPSLPITLSERDLLNSLGNHGYFCIPFESITKIIESFPAIETLELRTVSKPFYLAWENAAKNLLFISEPTIYHLGLEQGCNTLHERQQAEIKYLIENKEEILKQNDNDSRLINAFAKLALLENKESLVAYHAKEKYLTSLNETIIRIVIALTQKSDVLPTSLLLAERHLTRFPDDLFIDHTLSEFWRQVTDLIVDDNQLTSLPDAIGQCVSLQYLYVNNNQLTILPDSIGQCTSLITLIVSNNQLTTLPDTLGQCAALRNLYLTQNKLTALPKGLRDDINFLVDSVTKINKVQCLALQKKAFINTEVEAQEYSPMRPR